MCFISCIDLVGKLSSFDDNIFNFDFMNDDLYIPTTTSAQLIPILGWLAGPY